MKVKVRMLAFESEEVVREVEVPDNDKYSVNALLDIVYHYGQNDFAFGPEKNTTCSVSMGDVIELDNGDLFLIRSVGFRKMTPEQLEEYRKMERRERTFVAFD